MKEGENPTRFYSAIRTDNSLLCSVSLQVEMEKTGIILQTYWTTGFLGFFCS